MATETKVVSVRLPIEVWDEIKRIAHGHTRDASTYIRLLVERDIERHAEEARDA